MQRINLSSTPTADVITAAVAVLERGGLLLFPTETTYGAGVDATNPAAVQKLLAYKSRREGKPLSIAVKDQAMAEQYVELNDQAKTLYAQFLPGPLTVISTALPGATAPGVASEFGSLGVRIPAYPLLLDILAAYGKPITATSANASGKARPYSIESCIAELSHKQQQLIDLVLDAGELPHNPPSTVIDTTLSTPVTFRSGDISISPSTSSTVLTSQSEAETRAIAGKFLLKHWNDIRTTGLMLGLDGSLGVGKTVFAQGAAQFLGINERLTSPTYSYVESYDFSRHGVAGTLHHLDLWKVGSAAELERLNIAQLIQPNSVVIIEWFSPWAQLLSQLAHVQQVPLLHIKISDEDQLEQVRQLTLSESLT